MSIDKRLRDLRLEKNLTQKQVAEQLEISPTCYSGYEQGYREPDIKMIIKICKFFDVSADYLLGLKDEWQGASAQSYTFLFSKKTNSATLRSG